MIQIRSKRAVLVVLLGIVLLLLGFTFLSKTPLQQELNAIRRAGFPATPEDLDRWYAPVPPHENGAVVVAAAIDAHQDQPAIKQLRRGKENPFAPDFASSLEKYLLANRPVIQTLQELSPSQHSRFPVDLSLGPDALLPHLSEIRKLIFLLKLQAIDQSKSGNPKEALQAVQSGFALAHSLRDEPVLISQLVRLNSFTQIIEALQAILNEHQLDRGSLSILLGLVRAAEHDSYPALHGAYIGERVVGFQTLERNYRDLGRFVREKASDPRVKLQDAVAWRFRAATGRDFLQYLKTMEAYVQVFTNELPAMIFTSQAAEAEGNRIDIHGIAPTPALAPVVKTLGFLVAEFRCVQVALAIELYRADHDNRLPPDVANLVGPYLDEPPRDPFNDDPLCLTKTESGYRILSPAASIEKRGTKNEAKEVSFSVER